MVPVALTYASAGGLDVSYTSNQTSARGVLAHYCRVLVERRKVVTVTILDAEPAPAAGGAKEHAARVRSAILAARAPDGAADFCDYDNRRMRRAWYGADAAAVD